MTATEEGDASLVGSLLDQINAPITTVTADGAYDGDPIYRAVAGRAPGASVIIPPRATAVASEAAAAGTPTPRDRHIEMIAAKGRLGWQKAVGYGRRSLVETGMWRYKTIIGRTLRLVVARSEGRSQGRLQSAQSHDCSRRAHFTEGRLKPQEMPPLAPISICAPTQPGPAVRGARKLLF